MHVNNTKKAAYLFKHHRQYFHVAKAEAESPSSYKTRIHFFRDYTILIDCMFIPKFNFSSINF